jgi:hypothetical protein
VREFALPALIRWSGKGLAQHSSVSITTIRRTGLMPSATALTCVNDAAIRRALEQAGSNLSMQIKAGRVCRCGHCRQRGELQPCAKPSFLRLNRYCDLRLDRQNGSRVSLSNCRKWFNQSCDASKALRDTCNCAGIMSRYPMLETPILIILGVLLAVGVIWWFW